MVRQDGRRNSPIFFKMERERPYLSYYESVYSDIELALIEDEVNALTLSRKPDGTYYPYHVEHRIRQGSVCPYSDRVLKNSRVTCRVYIFASESQKANFVLNGLINDLKNIDNGYN